MQRSDKKPLLAGGGERTVIRNRRSDRRRARVGRNCMLIEVKLDAYDKICRQVVERRIETPQVTRTLIWLGCASASRTEASRQIPRPRHLISWIGKLPDARRRRFSRENISSTPSAPSP